MRVISKGFPETFQRGPLRTALDWSCTYLQLVHFGIPLKFSDLIEYCISARV